MASVTDPTPAVQTAAALKRQLLNSGWQEGPPPALPEYARLADVRAAHHMKCPAYPVCRRRGLVYQPYHHPLRKSYVVVVTCPQCGCGEVY